MRTENEEIRNHLKYLALLARDYPSQAAAASEIISTQALLKLPKGTEHFMSDLHGENEAFVHILNSASGVIREKVDIVLGDTIPEAARAELEQAIAEVKFNTPSCPVYQNVDAQPQTDPEKIKSNLIAQLTAPVRWTQIVKNMIADGVTEFTELGPGTVLQGLIKKVNPEAVVESKATM